MSTVDVVRPTVDQVGVLLRARTKDSEGVEQGTFTSTTRPTADQAQQLIDMAVDMVHAAVGGIPADSACATGAWTVGALGAACLIEKSYFPEQVNSARSPYEQYWAEYQSALNALARCLGVSIGGDGAGASLEWGQVPVAVAGLTDRPGCWRTLPEYGSLNQALTWRR